ncbi:MAG: hypothetical protein AAF438_09935 [Pseudomonadota bacterium]
MNISHRKLRWSAKKLELQDVLPEPKIHRIWIGHSLVKRPCPVFIEGDGFAPWMVPAKASIDGMALEDLKILEKGTRVHGTLPAATAGDEAEVNLGYTKATWRRTP